MDMQSIAIIAYHTVPKPVALILTDGNDQPIDYTGSTFKITVKARTSAGLPTGSVLLTLLTGGAISGDVSAGELHFVLPAQAASGLAPGSYMYDVMRLVGTVVQERVCGGTYDVLEGVSA